MRRRRGYGRRRSRGAQSQRRYTWVTVAVPPTLVIAGQALPFELLTPVRPAGDVTQEVYQNMTNPTVAAVMGNVTLFITRPLNCDAAVGAGNASYAWGIYKDSDAVDLSTFTRPFSEGNSNEWMMHRNGFLVDGARVICVGTGVQFYTPVGDLIYRRYEFNERKYKRRLDSQRDSLVFAVENPGAPFGETDLAVSAYFRILLLE